MCSSPTISIIIPCYNVAAFIQDAIDSIESQTCDYEAIFIDDGSKDNSYEIIEHLAAENPRLRLIRQTNQGASRARANGVEAATGEWITFLDADDVLLPSFSDTVAELAKFNADIFYSAPVNKTPKPVAGPIDIASYRNKIILGELYTGPCSKIFRRTVFNNFVFDIPSDIISAEDYLMNLRISFNTSKNVIISDQEYYLIRTDANPNSAMKTFRGSWAYLQGYDMVLNNSFPGNTRTEYLESLTRWRLNIWHHSFRKAWKLPAEAYDCEYFRRLQEDIRHCGFKLSAFEKWNMKLRNPALRASADLYIRFCGVMRRLAKERLK